MPIRKEYRAFYGKTWREVTRPKILARAGNKCEQCGKPDRSTVWVISLPVSGRRTQFWQCSEALAWVRCSDGAAFPNSVFVPTFRSEMAAYRTILVVLTIAHLNHTPGDDRDENLKALCQWCHLNWDKIHHAETRKIRKDLARPLLREAMA